MIRKLYVSSKGRMKTVTKTKSKKINTKIWIPPLGSDGRRHVTINKKTYLFSRLLCTTFYKQPTEEKPLCMHVDGDHTNDDPDNLKWGTSSQNNKDRMNTKNPGRQKKVDLRLVGGKGRWSTFDSLTEAADKHRLDLNNLSKCVKGKRKSVGGFEARLKPVRNLVGEKWKDIEDRDIMISNKGRLKRSDGSLIEKHPAAPGGTPYFVIRVKETNQYVHRMVAKHFLPAPSRNQDQVHHKDKNTYNNSATNLQWLTQAEHNKITNRQPKKAYVKKNGRPQLNEKWKILKIPRR